MPYSYGKHCDGAEPGQAFSAENASSCPDRTDCEDVNGDAILMAGSAQSRARGREMGVRSFSYAHASTPIGWVGAHACTANKPVLGWIIRTTEC